MLTPPPGPVADVYVRAYRAGIPWKDALSRAGVSRATWWRIENGKPFLSSTIERLNAAVDEVLAENCAAPDPAPEPATIEEAPAHGA